MPTKIDTSLLAHRLVMMPDSTKTKRRKEKISPKQCIREGVCPECLKSLPEPIRESREGGHLEIVTYCSNCGATYI